MGWDPEGEGKGGEGKGKRGGETLVTIFLKTLVSVLPQAAQGAGSRQQGRRSRRRPVTEEWEILEGLKSGQQFDVEPPAKFGGYIMKSRKWPMKGWHKVSEIGRLSD